MRWGVFSDVHSNLEALLVVLEYFEKEKVDGYVCGGDITGYGADSDKAIEIISALPNLFCVRGNHDLAVLGRMDINWFNDMAAAAVRYAQKSIGEKNMRWLQDLPPRVDQGAFTLVHGSPRNAAEEYLVTVQQFHDNYSYFRVSPCFIGHSHLPLCFLMKEPVSYVEFGTLKEGSKIRSPRGIRCVINPGSVGQPRDHDHRASCGIYDDETRAFLLVRLEYDVAEAQRKILDAGLPEFLALRLAYGQ